MRLKGSAPALGKVCGTPAGTRATYGPSTGKAPIADHVLNLAVQKRCAIPRCRAYAKAARRRLGFVRMK
jgi:hypothetical protein